MSPSVRLFHPVSWHQLFTALPEVPNFARSECGMEGPGFDGTQPAVSVAQQSAEGGFSAQTGRASCVLGSPKRFGHPKTDADTGSAGTFLQSRNSDRDKP